MPFAIARRERDCVAGRRVSRVRRHYLPNPVCYTSITDIVRVSQGQHSIQRSDGKGDLGLVGTRSKRIADHALVSADRCLDLGSLIVAVGFLPRHAAPYGSHPQLTVAQLSGRSRPRHSRPRPPAAAHAVFRDRRERSAGRRCLDDPRGRH